MTDPHRVLGVPADATPAEISSAYHRLVRQYHPDTGSASTTEPDRFREVVAAYAALRGQPPKPAVQPLAEPLEPGKPVLRAGPVRYHGPPTRGSG